MLTDAQTGAGHSCSERDAAVAESRHDVSCPAAGMEAQPAVVLQQLTGFLRIGGAPAVAALVDRFYERMDTLPQAAGIRGLHASDLTATKDVLRHYLGEWLGGPALYSQERGHPQLRRRHIRFDIGPAERDAWMLCMRAAVEDVVADTALREELLAALFKLADWVRNDEDNPHDEHR